MQAAFECLIDSYIACKVGISENFLQTDLAAQLKVKFNERHLQDQFHQAGTGKGDKLLHNHLLRSDKIYWLDRSHNDPFENQFFDLIDQFVLYLNRSCFTGITGYEFHYTLYEKGSFYKRHLDQFRNSSSRAFSMIMYLNNDWKQSDGGELCIYQKDHSQLISPVNSKCVFFKSDELEHEVLITNSPRLSITGWLKVG